MTRLLEITYWRLKSGSQEEVKKVGSNFRKFASRNLDAIFKFGFVQTGTYRDFVAFVFLWEDTAKYNNWQHDAPTNTEFQEWVGAFAENGELNRSSHRELISIEN
jgi:hypothetical protein